MRIERFYAAFILLSLITILLLFYSVQFFYAASVRTQFDDWMRQMAQGFGLWNVEPTPLPTQGVSLAAQIPPAATPTPTPAPTAEPTGIPPSPEPTRPPIFQVIEDPVPDGSLVIPSLGIDQSVVPIYLKEEAWDLESLGPNVGWLETTGSHPGDDLAMVLVGHITLPPPGGPGPFLSLSSLKPGDVVIYRGAEETYVYHVKGQSIVEPDQVEYLYQPDGSRILLVTCTGYNPIEMRYDLRLVIEADLISVEKNATAQ